jgi:predicted dehydrogenase
MINVAIVGFGFMGVTHALHIQRNPKLNLRAVVTKNVNDVPSKLSEQTGNFSIGLIDTDSILRLPRYTTLEECLEHEKVDAVHICVHTDLHYALAKEAIERGLHVLVEKPFTLSIDEGKTLIELAAIKKVKLMVAHVVRFMPAYKKLKEWIDGGEHGKLQFIALNRFTGLPTWGQWREKQEKFGSSGGALFDLLIHDIDFLNYALGTPGKIESVCYPGELSKQDYVSADWYYDNVKARVEGGNIFHSGFPFQAGYRARFERASVVYSSANPLIIQVATNESTESITVGDPNEGFYNEIDYFASCVATNTEPTLCLPQSSLETVELCYKHLVKKQANLF